MLSEYNEGLMVYDEAHDSGFCLTRLTPSGSIVAVDLGGGEVNRYLAVTLEIYMEHFNLFMIRSNLAKLESQVTAAQKARLEKADAELFAQAGEFFNAIHAIADLRSWREQEQAPPSHWW